MNIVIDGNISSGKTTQLDLLEKIVTKVKREPIDEWPLDLYYSDPERWGLAFQMIALQTRKKEECDCIYERCPYSSMNIFWPLMKKTDIEDRIYQTAYEKEGWGPDIYILIDKNPEKCFEHLSQRNQDGDSGVSLDYLKQLDTQYQKMYEKLDCKKFKIDGNQKVLNVHDQIVKIIKENCRDIINV
jgi:deoxyadenosine/deoxycytidine kinase